MKNIMVMSLLFCTIHAFALHTNQHVVIDDALPQEVKDWAEQNMKKADDCAKEAQFIQRNSCIDFMWQKRACDVQAHAENKVIFFKNLLKNKFDVEFCQSKIMPWVDKNNHVVLAFLSKHGVSSGNCL